MARRTNTRIWKPHIILCEGRDAEEFLIAYLNSSALSDIPSFSTDIQVMDFGGNSELSSFLLMLTKMEGFNTIKSILIIRDAEQDPQRAILDIKSALFHADMAVPPTVLTWSESNVKIGYLLFPTLNSTTEKGTLEDFCLQILKEERSPAVLKQITEFMQQLSSEDLRTFPRPFKTRLHTYFSITDPYVSLKVGEAAKANAFDWNTPLLLPLKNFLQQTI